MSAEEREGKQRNEEIENQLKRDKLMQRNEIKMLLLGECPVAGSYRPSRCTRADRHPQVLASPANRPSSSR